MNNIKLKQSEEFNEKVELITNLNRNISKMKNELVFAKYSLNSLSQDIIHLMIAQIKNEFILNPEFNIKIKTIEEKLNRKLKEEEIITACDNISTQRITINSSTDLLHLNWCEYVHYSKEERSLKIKFTSKVSYMLLNLKKQGGFTKMNLKYFLKLRSFHAKRVYLLVKSNSDFENERKNNKESIKVISIADFKDNLNLDSNSYKEIGDFKKRVLDIAVKQINEFTDLDIKVEFLRGEFGKKLVDIKFTTTIKEGLKIELEDIEEIEINTADTTNTEFKDIVKNQKKVYEDKNKISTNEWLQLSD